MSDKNNILKTYEEFRRFLQTVQDEEFYAFFKTATSNSNTAVSIYEKYVDKSIDLKWVEKLEEALLPLDSIVRNPVRFIKREENIVSIEQARGISAESLKHLSKHSDMISSVSKNGEVTPTKILDFTKEESVETYENRFIFTLLRLVNIFLEKRVKDLIEDGKGTDVFEYKMDGDAKIGIDSLSYHVDVKLRAPLEDKSVDELLATDVTFLTPIERVNRLRKIYDSFLSSPFIRSVGGCAPIRPPLVITNVLKKNPNFMKAVALWDFLNGYTEKGYSTEFVEGYRTPSESDKDEMFAVLMFQYVMMKKQNGGFCEETFTKKGKSVQGETGESGLQDSQVITDITESDLKKALESVTPPESTKANGTSESGQAVSTQNGTTGNGDKVVKIIAPEIVRHSINELCEDYSLTVDEIHKIYQKEIRKKTAENESGLLKARGIFDRALTFERETGKLAETARRAQILREFKKRMKK